MARENPGNPPVLDEAALLPWRDASLPVAERVEDLLARMSPAEKLAQLYGVWVGVDPATQDVAPRQEELGDVPLKWEALIAHGLGHLTRPFGTAPVVAVAGAAALAAAQADLVAAGRHGIPAIAHEECLSGFMAWGATIYPTPLAWAATFDPDLVETMAGEVGASLRAVGVHQGLAPVLDVARDHRWGRTEETLGEDPYLVGTLATAYVRGLESAGVVATLKHFVGYSASRSGRNFGPVAVGPRELADVLLPPFEMALRHGGARSVMQAYVEIDGIPVGADPALLTGLLRDRWGFSGTVVSDYFGIAFLRQHHRLAASDAAAAGLALAAGIDIELPTVHCYGDPLLGAVESGSVPMDLVDRAARRVLRQKCELGLLDAGWEPSPAALTDGVIDLDPPASRALARRLAEESVVLAANDGILPLRSDARVALVGPRADDPLAMLGCYTFPSHVVTPAENGATPDLGVEIPTLARALSDELPLATVRYEPGCGVDGADTAGIEAAVALARSADVCVVALGDRAGLFGRGTSGEGCDAADLDLPGVQGELLAALVATGTPVVLVMIAGRPYALGPYVDGLAAVVQSFFPGEEGGPALAGVLSGRVCPSGRLPVSVPKTSGSQPTTYLTPPLGRKSDGSNLDLTPLWPFGHGLSYTTFEWTAPQLDGTDPVDGFEVPTDGHVEYSVTVTNSGDRRGAEVVQFYLADPLAQVTRPILQLTGYQRVELEPGASARVTFRFSADLSSFTGLAGHRLVEPGDLQLILAGSSDDPRHTARIRLTGPQRSTGPDRDLIAPTTVTLLEKP